MLNPNDPKFTAALLEFAERCWEANQKQIVTIAESAVASANIPPLVTKLPEMPRFLGLLQKRCFVAGVAAAVVSLSIAADERAK